MRDDGLSDIEMHSNDMQSNGMHSNKTQSNELVNELFVNAKAHIRARQPRFCSFG